ncbi:uncharacterized protein, partial [Amphiura filiformis]|uniref:uncharacterized protein n=1 Tax=Amphiura filiformis TaxID=82378 RepID=UPI003B21C350
GLFLFLFKKKEKEDTIEITISKALLQEMKGHIDQAEKIMHQALDMALKDKNQQAVTYIYDQMANMLLRQGKFVEAEIAFKETLRRLITSGTEKTDPAVIEISLKLAQIYSATRRIAEAQAGFQWCIDTTEKLILSSVASPSSSSSPSAQERIDTSEILPLPTVSETAKTESPSSSSSSAPTAAEPYDFKDLKALLGMCLEAYARFFAKYKKYDDAIVIAEAQAGFQWCIDTTEKLILSSVASPSSSSSPSAQERIDTSEILPLPTVSETAKTESPSSSSSSAPTAAEPYDIKDLKALLGMCLEAYARFFAKYKKYDDAIVLFTRALSISENDLMEDGHPHQESVTILNDLGTVYDLKGDYNKAKDCIRRSAQLAQRLGNDHSLPTIVCNLASVEAHSGNYTEAQRLYRKALKQAERQEDSRTVTIIKNKLAQLETDQLLKKK